MTIDEKIKQLIEDRINQISSHSGRNYFRENPYYPEQEKDRNIQDIEKKIKKLKSIHYQVGKRIKKFKNLISEITEQTVICATYLIYGKILQTWETIFLLARKGHNFDIMELIRSIDENLDLIRTFHLDKEEKHLKEWFEGKIIGNRIVRQISGKFVSKQKIKDVVGYDVSYYDLATDVYKSFSKYTHCSYAALLDSVDTFNEDFDWKRYAGTHYTLHNMHTLDSAMTKILTTLKATYLELKDIENYKEVDGILVSFAGPMNEETLKDLISRIKE